MNTSSGPSVARPPEGSKKWHREAACVLEDSVARLAGVDRERLDDAVLRVLATLGRLVGADAVIECSDRGRVCWTDPTVVPPPDIDEIGAALPEFAPATGPTSLWHRPGEYAVLVVPADTGTTSVVVVTDPGRAPGADAIRLVCTFGSVVATARRRSEAEAELLSMAEQQVLLGTLSTQAATELADETTLHEMLESACAVLGVAAVGTLVRDGDQMLLVDATDGSGDLLMPPGVRFDTDAGLMRELTEVGYVVRGLRSFRHVPEAATGEVLCVPRISDAGVEGLVVFADDRRQAWSLVEIEAAKSVARSIQKLTLRTEIERAHRRRHELDRLISAVASRGARTTLGNLEEVVEETLGLVIDSFGIRGASLWSMQDGTASRMMGRLADGQVTRRPLIVPGDEEVLQALVERGHGFMHLGELESDGVFSQPDCVALVVPVGSDPSGFAVFFDPDRWWSEVDIAAARAIADLAEHTRIRLKAEAVMHSRLRSEAFTSLIASMAVDVSLDTVGARLHEVLERLVSHFGVVEASLWQVDGDALVCRAAERSDEAPTAFGTRLPGVDFEGLEQQGWALLRLGSIDLSRYELNDPDSSKVLVTAFGGPDGLIGALVLTDPTRRWWDDESIGSARAVADILGQVHLRMEVARRLRRQREIERMLSEASARFVHATLDDVIEVAEVSLGEFRERFGLRAVSLFHADRWALQARCMVEVTDDGADLLRWSFPMPIDDPAAVRLLGTHGLDEYPLADLVDSPATAGCVSLVSSVTRDRDAFALVATTRHDEPFDPDLLVAFQSVTSLLAQLRYRLLLELHSRRRGEADHLVGAIARSFVEQPPHDHEDAVAAGLDRIGEFFDLRIVGIWDVGPDGSVASESRRGEELPDHDSLRDALRTWSIEAVDMGDETAMVQPLQRDGAVVGVIIAVSAKPAELIVDLDIQREVLVSVARLIEQLRKRAESDRAVARQLVNEDALRRFATRLVAVEADASDELETALGEVVALAGVDQATIWHWAPTEDGFEVNAVLHASGPDVGPLAERFQAVRLPVGFTDREIAPYFWTEISTWTRETAPLGMRRMLDESTPPGPRQVAFFPAPGSDPLGEGSYLVVSRPGLESFRPDELEFFRSAHSILIQHQARITAERWFGVAFDSAPIGISLRMPDMTMIHCNQAYSDLVDRPVADLVGTNLYDIMPREIAEERTALFDGVYGETVESETSYRRPNGTIRWASVRTTPVRIPGRRPPLLLTYAEDITERRRTREMLEYQATHDELTGLPNRRALVAEIAEAVEGPGECAVLVLDLDRFKVVNDSLGHSVGDQLLVTCADRIRLSLRPGDSVCRLGGDEFAILLREPANPAAAGVVAERLISLLREPVVVGDDEVFPSASVGVAHPRPGDTVEDLLRHADAAMYQAKGRGRDCWSTFDGSMRQAVVDRIRTETDLRRAIENGQLEVHYQPEFLLESGEIVGTEALVRWRHPERGLLAAGSFIGLAEESGLVVDLGRWVLTQATMQGARWLADGHDIITRVNLSARQLRGAVVSEVEEALAAAGLPAERLCLELTETSIMDDVQESSRVLSQFHELGVQVAIDDFGTGFSSLAYLKRFPVDILKIDRTFVDGVGVDPDDTAIVRSVIGLARTLRLEVVAEGIEDETQIGELIRLGCDRGQGFHLARPAPAAEVSALLADDRVGIRAPRGR